MHAAAVPLLASLLCYVVAAAAVTEEPLHTLKKSCQFTLGNRRFDLCPVFEGNEGGWNVAYDRQTPPTVTKTEYKISFAGALKKSKKVPSHEQCPDGTWICLIVSNTRPKHDDEDPRVLQVVPVAGELSLPDEGDSFARDDYVPGVNITAKLVPARTQTKHDILHIHLHGGYYVYRQQKADFQFVCDHQVDEPSSPGMLWNWNGTHTFEWRTKHACGERLATPTKPASEPEPTDEPKPDDDEEQDADAPPQDDENKKTKGEHKLLDPDLVGARSRQYMMTLAASSAAVMLVLMYILYFPPPRVRQMITKYVKTHPWLLRSRVGERVLVRWAYEDFSVDGAEEDTMVNDREFEGMIALDEQIPLKPSPRRTVTVSYGSA